MTMPWKDEIVEGVREARRKLGEAHGNDLRRIVEHLRQKEQRSDHRIVTFSRRPPRQLKKVSGSSAR
jgi:hypothetical protein